MRSLKLAVVVVALVVTGSGNSSAVAQDEGPTVTIGAWNIEWLGVPGNRSGIGKNVAQKPADLAAYIDLSGVEILSLEEIGDDDGDSNTRTSSTLNATFQMLNNAGADWEYRLFPKKNPIDKNQLVGVAWNKHVVTLEGEPFHVGIVDNTPEHNLWDRDPFAIKFQMVAGKNDLVVIPLHMKSNVGGAAVTRERRKKEAQALVARLAAIKAQFKDEDIILLGDTNILNATESAAMIYTSHGFTDLNGFDEPTTFHGPAPFDRIFVPDNQPEFDNSFEFIIDSGFTANDHKKKLSDHYMVTTTVMLQDADDDAD